ncbi:MAG: hypothetical protein ACOCWG_00560 [bacterium]
MFNKGALVLFSIILLLSGLSFLTSLIHDTADYLPAYSYLVFAIEGFAGSYLFYIVFLRRLCLNKVIRAIINISVFQSVIIVLMFFFEPLREFIFALVETDSAGIVERYGGFRGLGLSSSLTYDLSVFLSISMIFIVYLIAKGERNYFLYSFYWILLFIAVLMTGRSGYIGVVLSLFFVVILVFQKNMIKWAVTFFLSFFIIGFAGTMLMKSMMPGKLEVVKQSVIPYAFEFFINFSEDGALTTASIQKLNEMYFDVSSKTFFLGDGYWDDPVDDASYKSTDAGYMRHLLFYGFFPSFILYAFYLLGFFIIYKSIKDGLKEQLLIGFIASIFFIIHYKGDFLMGSSMNIKLFCILLLFSFLKNQSNEQIHENFIPGKHLEE